MSAPAIVSGFPVTPSEASGLNHIAMTTANAGDVVFIVARVVSTTITATGLSTTGTGTFESVEVVPPWTNVDGNSITILKATVLVPGSLTATLTFSSSVSGINVELDAISFAGLGGGTIWTLVGTPAQQTNSSSSTSIACPSLTASPDPWQIYLAYTFAANLWASGVTSGFVSDTTANGNGLVYNTETFTGGDSYAPVATQSPAGVSYAFGIMVQGYMGTTGAVEVIGNTPTWGENVPIATLSTTISTTSAISTLSASNAPTTALQAGQWRGDIDSEGFLFGPGISGDTWTVLARGIEGTTAATHTSGASIYHVWSALGVANALGSTGRSTWIPGTTYTLAATDAGAIGQITNAAGCAVTVPASSAAGGSVAWPTTGLVTVFLLQVGPEAFTVTPATGVSFIPNVSPITSTGVGSMVTLTLMATDPDMWWVAVSTAPS